VQRWPPCSSCSAGCRDHEDLPCSAVAWSELRAHHPVGLGEAAPAPQVAELTPQLVMGRRVSRQVREKIETFDESGMGYWVVRATLRDGRVFSNVFINDLFQLGFPDLSPFKAREGKAE
jgi:hypothetical protein